jgi:hypothetical protein
MAIAKGVWQKTARARIGAPERRESRGRYAKEGEKGQRWREAISSAAVSLGMAKES